MSKATGRQLQIADMPQSTGSSALAMKLVSSVAFESSLRDVNGRLGLSGERLAGRVEQTWRRPRGLTQTEHMPPSTSSSLPATKLLAFLAPNPEATLRMEGVW